MSSYGAYLTSVALATGCFPLTMLEPPAYAAQRDDRIPGTPLPDFKRHNHNAKLKGWQKGKGKRK